MKNLIEEYIKESASDFETISVARKKDVLEPIIHFIITKFQEKKEIKLIYVCTHNSRRSQFSQVWSEVLSHFHEIPTKNFSGGVEVTAFNERAIRTLSDIGFEIEKTDSENPHYTFKYAENAKTIVGFSKIYDDKINPNENFAAIMTCSHADENCPVILGCDARLPLRYEDPKAFDNTYKEIEAYANCSQQIATEMNFIFTNVKARIS